jgi:carboxypeptidase family protein/TonB-dependent receptor-like protein
MKILRSFLVAVTLFVSLGLVTVGAHAQFRTSIKGTVTDASGGVIAGATLTLTNLGTNEKIVRVSDGSGVYNFNALPTATFRLEVEKKDFQKNVIENLVLIPEQPNNVDVVLTIGGATQTVVVDGSAAPEIDRETASISGTVTTNQIEHMPSFGRDVFQLIQLAPGVFGDGAQGNGGGSTNLPGTQGPGGTGGSTGIFATENGPQALANGGQYENNSITIDGISTTSAVWGGTTVITPSEDSVESVKVISNGYDAENGRFSGAQIQVTSKSGTNDIHGSLFFTAHRPGLDAYQRYNGPGNSVLRDDNFFDQFGGSVGGPIWKNKIFAFFNYETVREPNHASPSNGWYETPAFAALAPSGSISSKYLSFPGSAALGTVNNATCADAGLIEGTNCVTIPGQGLNIGSPITTGLGTQDLGYLSSANPGVGGGLSNVADIANYTTSATSTSNSVQYNGRLDAVLSDKDRINFSLYYVPQSSTFLNGAARQYNFFHHSQINEAFSGVWDHTFSPSFLNEARANAAGWRWNEVNSNSQSPVGLPSDSIGQIGNITLNSFGPNVGSILDQWTYSIKDVATKIIGNHTIKFGGEITRLFYLQDCAGCGVPSYSFFNLWDFLNDAPKNEASNFDPTTGKPTTIRQDDRQDFWGFFIQDDFKLRRNLTINLGLRWSYFGPLSSKENNMFAVFPGAGADFLTGLNVRKGNSWNAQKGNFGPQVGFAWSPTRFHDKLVVRGGYGLSYNQEEIAVSSGIVNNPGLAVFSNLDSASATSINPNIIYAVSSGIHDLTGYPANPNTVASFAANGLPSSGAQVNLSIFPRNLPTMYTHHYSLDTEYDLGHNLVVSVGYQGSQSRNIYFHSNPNALFASQGLALNPQVGGGDYWGVNGRGNYNALLTELKHPFSKQFMMDAQFTWSKSMDTSSAPYSEQIYPYATNLNYGPSDYNVGKAFKLYGLWQPVFFHGSSHWVEKVVGGWSVSGIWNVHSGFPWNPVYNITGGNLYCGTCNYSQLLPLNLGGAGSSTSNDAFKTGSNFPNGSLAYFGFPSYTAYTGSNFGNANPQLGIGRNSFTGPGYKDVDMTLSKAFGLPKLPVLGENSKLEFRVDAYNLFNNLNFNPTSISNSIGCKAGPGCVPTDPSAPGIGNPTFGQATSALAARTITLGARFSF